MQKTRNDFAYEYTMSRDIKNVMVSDNKSEINFSIVV